VGKQQQGCRSHTPASHCCYQGCSSGSHMGFPIKPRARISGISPAGPLHLLSEAKPSIAGSQPFPSETSCPGWRAGSNRLDFCQGAWSRSNWQKRDGKKFAWQLPAKWQRLNPSLCISGTRRAQRGTQTAPQKLHLSKAPLSQATPSDTDCSIIS